MKTFREHLSEEIKIGALASGGIGIERDAVRDEINGILSGISSQPCITPYGSLNKIRKALAYFSIFLPKKVYMEGRHGIEVWEIHQFGDKMGMTDQGEFIKSVPAKYYLFLHYHLIGSMYFLESKIVDDNELEERLSRAERMVAEEADAANRQGIAKAMAPKEPMHDEDDDTVSTKKAVEVSMRRKDKKLSADSLDEEKQEHIYTHEKGPQYGTVIDHGGKFFTRRKVGMYWRTKSHNSKDAAIAHLENDKKKKLKEDALDEAMTRKQKDMAVRRFMSHDPKAGESILAMGKKEREEKKSFASAKKEIKRLKEEEQIDELKKSTLASYIKKAHVSGLEAASQGEIAYARKDKAGLHAANKTGEKREQGIERAANKLSMKESRMPPSVIAHKQKLASMSDKEFAEKHGHKSEKQLRDMAARHGYGFDKATKTGSDHYVKRATVKEDTLEESAKKKEKFEKISKAFKDVPGQTRGERDSGIMSSMGKQKETVHRGEIRRALKKHLYGDKNKKVDQDVKDAKEKAKEKIYWPKGRPVRENVLDEKAPPGAKYERMVKHIKAGYAKDGLTTKEKGIAFATAWKAKKKEQMDEAMGSVKKSYAYKKLKTKASTIVRKGLGKKRDTNTVLVTNKGDPHAATGGGVRRIAKDKYDPSKHNLASE